MTLADRLNVLHLNLLNLRRLSGIPLSRKADYLIRALCGEFLRFRSVGVFGLRLVEISLTDRCQCRCFHCFAAAGDSCLERKELNTSEIAALLDDLAKLKVPEVCFSGGEPLLRNDIVELVGYAHKKGFVVRLITNGILLTEKLVNSLKNAGLNWCSVSLDSARAEVHDEFRGYSGCFEKAMSGLRLLVHQRIPCSIITVARKELLHSGELEDIVKLGQKLGVTVTRINFPVPIGRFKNQEEHVLNLEEREQVRKLLRYGSVSMESPRENTSCTAAVTKMNILTNGDVTPCVFVPLSYGNIREHKFYEIWEAMDSYIREYKINGQCPMCDPFMRDKVFNAAEDKSNTAWLSFPEVNGESTFTLEKM